MKPITLEISGINSFSTKKIIDFSKLTEHGLFGISGETGSGKSTIIDCITLALYGEIPRYGAKGATPQFINLNCDFASVVFKFSVGDEAVSYRISRTYKFDKNKIVADRAMIERKTNETQIEILGNGKINSVTAEVKKILGLSYEDFTKSVILPQGKFDEFLRLSGKERRTALERIFRLEKYGEALSKATSEKKKSAELRKKGNADKLLSFESFEQEEIEKKEQLFSIKKAEATELDKKLAKLYSKKDALTNWERITNSIAEYAEKLDNADKNEDNVKNLEVRLKNHMSAEALKPVFDEIEKNNRRTEEITQEISAKNKDIEVFAKKQEENKTALQSAELAKNEKLPELYALLERLNSASDTQKKLEELKKEREELLTQYKTAEKAYKSAEAKAIPLQEKQDELKKTIELLKKDMAENTVSPDEWQAIAKAEAVAALADGVKPGEACPLCGSYEHPNVSGIENEMDFEVERQRLANKEQKREELENEIVQKEKILSDIPDKLKLCLDEMAKQALNKEKIAVIGNEKKNFIDSLAADIASIVNGGDLAELTKHHEKQIENLNKNLEIAKDSFDKSERAFKEAQDGVVKLYAEKEAVSNIISQKSDELAEKLQNTQFESYNEASKHLISDKELEIIKSNIELHRNTKRTAVENLERLNNELDVFKSDNAEFEPSKENLPDIDKSLDETKNAVDERNVEIGKLSAWLELAYANKAEAERLKAEQAEITAELDIYDELSKLFRGDKFIDFVAKRHLAPIVKEAAARLRRMTSGNYDIKLAPDTSGLEFLIVDNVHDSKIRHPSSLSGGESFIVSLCLALALSGNIQLKNNKPLEFFFLDEGFGTLDGKSLDTVTNCLESLRQDSMTVGIISHHEGIMERMPVKLAVKKDSLTGSNVIIEQ
jgi:exonuclease SbcC